VDYRYLLDPGLGPVVIAPGVRECVSKRGFHHSWMKSSNTSRG